MRKFAHSSEYAPWYRHTFHITSRKVQTNIFYTAASLKMLCSHNGPSQHNCSSAWSHKMQSSSIYLLFSYKNLMSSPLKDHLDKYKGALKCIEAFERIHMQKSFRQVNKLSVFQVLTIFLKQCFYGKFYGHLLR